jgi:NTE family protein
MQTSRIGLALSGGGYRAAVFHLGTLQKLEELKILSKVDVISTISGGSITGAALCLHEGDYPSFHKVMYDKLKTKSVIREILTSYSLVSLYLFFLTFIGLGVYFLFSDHQWLFIIDMIIMCLLFLKYQFRLFPISKDIEKAYDKFFFSGARLKDLKDKPLLAIGSSNLQTGRPFTFSKLKMNDSTYTFEYAPPVAFVQDNFPLSRAVTASSCVPYAFTPVTIDKMFYKDEEDAVRISPQLVDGGVYDNQGIQKITQPKSLYECNTIIVSDAGGPFSRDEKYPNFFYLLIRTMDLFMYRIKNAQIVQNIYRKAGGSGKPIAYIALSWEIKNCITGFVDNMVTGQVIQEVVNAHGFDPLWIADPKNYTEEIKSFLEIKTGYADIVKMDLTADEHKLAYSADTNLDPLTEKCMACLVRHAGNFTELQVKLYCPGLVDTI